MAKPQFTPARLAMICAQSTRWPKAETSIFWKAGHEAVAALIDRTRRADVEIASVESDSSLSDVGRLRKIGTIALDAVNALPDLPELARMRAQAERDVRMFESKVGDPAAAPTDAATALLYQEIRAQIRAAREPIIAAMERRHDPRVVAAVASAPAFLSGLSDTEHGTFAQAARSALWPDETGRIGQIQAALAVVEKGVGQVQRMIAERGQLLAVGDGWELPRAAKAA